MIQVSFHRSSFKNQHLK